LLTQTHSLRKFPDEAKAAQQANPEDLNAAVRIFYYYQQQGKLDAAQETIAKFRLRKDSSDLFGALRNSTSARGCWRTSTRTRSPRASTSRSTTARG